MNVLKEKQQRKFRCCFSGRCRFKNLKTFPHPKRILFVCSRNRLRSPTAEQVFSDYKNIEVSSAGLSPDAEELLTVEMVEWADIIFVMEKGFVA